MRRPKEGASGAAAEGAYHSTVDAGDGGRHVVRPHVPAHGLRALAVDQEVHEAVEDALQYDVQKQLLQQALARQVRSSRVKSG